MKKKLLSLAMCLCLAATCMTGCKKEDKKTSDSSGGSETQSETEEDLISIEDDNAEALHKILMERVGDYALKYAEIGDYNGLEIEVEKEQEITDEVLQDAIDNLLETYAYDFTGEVVSGQTVNIDYAGSLDGELFDGGSAEAYDLTIGSGSFIPGFEEQLIGMKVGDTQTITVTFPEEYSNTDLAGKEAQFEVTVNGIALEEGKSEFNEQWIALLLKMNSGVITDASVEGFKDQYRKLLEDAAAEQRETDVKNAIADKLVELVELKEGLPEEQRTYFQNMYLDYLENYASSYSMSLDDYMSQTGMTDEDVTNTSENQMKYEYAFLLIGENDDIIPTEDDYTAFLQGYADDSSISVDEFRSMYQSDYQLSLYVQTYIEKVLDKLMETVVITDVEPTETDDTTEAVSDGAAE